MPIVSTPGIYPLDGKTAVYESFKHSQGDATIQAELLTILEQRHGIAPDFMLDPGVMERYRRFLDSSRASDSQSHVAMTSRDGKIRSAVRYAYGSYKGFLATNQSLTPERRLGQLTVAVAKLETSRFDENLWYSRRRQIRTDRLRRLQARLKDGKLSFLSFYGGAGGGQPHTTGYAELDELYGDMAAFYDRNSSDETIVSHREQLASAPERIIAACQREGIRANG